MKEKLEQIKEWNNTKTSSIIKLSIWIIIIIIIAGLTKINTQEETIQEKNKEKTTTPISEKILAQLKTINNYEEEIIVETEIVENINLTQSNEKTIITYNGENYYKTDLLYKLPNNEITENKLLTDITQYNIKTITEYLENIEEDYITVYRDNSYKICYTITNEETIENITINGNETINKIEINFQNYYIKNITINISNINNIENIEVE